MGNLWTRFAAAAALLTLALIAIPQTRVVGYRALRAAGIERGPRTLQTGDQLTELNLSSLNGTPVTVANTGRPQIINVFATWCTPCKAETPGLARAAATLRSSGVELIGIDQSESGPIVAHFARENDLQYPIFVDGDGSVTHKILGARFIPTTIVVDRHGVIRFEHAGPLSQADFAALAAAVRSAG
ncbi:MAG: TlpA family protein disulfide reductase [Vulcanimicrobiaceae bacterium]